MGASCGPSGRVRVERKVGLMYSFIGFTRGPEEGVARRQHVSKA